MEKIKNLEMNTKSAVANCYHCGDECRDDSVSFDNKQFCCPGCRFVFELLEDNDLCMYYDLDQAPGISPKEAGGSIKYSYLEDESVIKRLIQFTDSQTSTATFYIPAMHCSSCVWLLENLYKLNPLVKHSKVDFLKKELSITFEQTASSLRQVVELLASIGYEPQINLDSLSEKHKKESNRELYIKIGIAGFCFINIMLLSLPEYLSIRDQVDLSLQKFFSFLNIILALPVLFYSGIDYFKSALYGWKQRMINMDVPISLGILALFSRSMYELLSGTGSGYMDSFTGLVFFLLIGKLFEKKTYDTLSFERDYRSYFPVSVTKKVADGETTIPLNKLQIKDRILIRNGELIPADSVLIRGNALIDFSFVTGESKPVPKSSGDLIYAGGRQVGEVLELDVVKEIDQGYLTDLWNDAAFSKSHVSRITSLANQVSRYFTAAVLAIAIAAASYWYLYNPSFALNAFTAVLIIACPCALALSTPFTLGNTLRIFGKNGFYLKNTAVIEAMSKITSIVFDKTGTITYSGRGQINFKACDKSNELSRYEIEIAKSTAYHSGHPLSKQIYFALDNVNVIPAKNVHEEAGKGIEAIFGNQRIRLGSREWVHLDHRMNNGNSSRSSKVYMSIDEKVRGYFELPGVYRKGLSTVVDQLKEKFSLSLLTGDNDSERRRLLKLFGSDSNLLFEQSPVEKLYFVKENQKSGEHILMIGDGLNDAGALKQSDVGISLTEDVNNFTPASDAILDSKQFEKLPEFLEFSAKSMSIIVISFVISFLYNLIGLSFAIQGILSPLISAILMPISSISVVLFTTGMTNFYARKKGFKLLVG